MGVMLKKDALKDKTDVVTDGDEFSHLDLVSDDMWIS